MRTLLLIWLSLVWSAPAWAEVTVIYRKADRLVASYVYPPHSVEAEIRNTTKSELGGMPEDYATATVSEEAWTEAQRQGQDIQVNQAGAVVFVPNLKHVANESARRSAEAKLKAAGLTDQELSALFNR